MFSRFHFTACRAAAWVLIIFLAGACATVPTPTALYLTPPSPAATTTSPAAAVTERPSRAGEMPTGPFARGSTWTTGAKQGVGTAFTYDQPASSNTSRVWFTITHGALTDVLYPMLDQPNVRELKFLVSDGNKLYDETTDLEIKITHPDPRALLWYVESTDAEGRFRLMKTFLADPDADTVMLHTQFEALKGTADDFHLYVYFVPLLGGTGKGNHLTLNIQEPRATVTAGRTAATLVSDQPWPTATAGYLRAGDGLTDLQAHKTLLMNFDAATRGDYPTLTAELPTGRAFTLALGLGPNAEASLQAAQSSLARGFDEVQNKYVAGWNRYCASLDTLNGQANAEYFLSATLLRAAEDKTHRGAVVASFAVPWGDHVLDRPEDRANFTGYRRTWARDAYHTALGLWAAGDKTTPSAILKFLDDVQQNSDGSLPQNSYLDGTTSWTGLQLDEVADPILLAWQLGAEQRYTSLVKPAADFIVKNGPRTPQERWEEMGGYSPATLAAEIAGLVAAGDLAQHAGDAASAKLYRDTAQQWDKNLEAWTYTHTGTLGARNYFLRIATVGKPDVQDVLTLANGGATVDQRSVVDPSFLELVRLGVLRPDDERILVTLPIVDKNTRAETPNGLSWYRYPGDRYGETGRTPATFLEPAKGHPWPLLTGERAMYELAAGYGEQAEALLLALERFANDGGMIPEQVWEETGEGTGSATPLLWAHAEYILLLKSTLAGSVVDRPAVVYDFFKH